MRFIFKTLLIGIAAYFSLRMFPWWSVLVISFVANMIIKTRGSSSFFSSFFGIAISWFLASFVLYSAGAQEFAGKMARVFSLAVPGLVFIMIVSTLIGLVGALSGYCGNAFRNIFIKPKTRSKERYGRPDYSRYSR